MMDEENSRKSNFENYNLKKTSLDHDDHLDGYGSSLNSDYTHDDLDNTSDSHPRQRYISPMSHSEWLKKEMDKLDQKKSLSDFTVSDNELSDSITSPMVFRTTSSEVRSTPGVKSNLSHDELKRIRLREIEEENRKIREEEQSRIQEKMTSSDLCRYRKIGDYSKWNQCYHPLIRGHKTSCSCPRSVEAFNNYLAPLVDKDVMNLCGEDRLLMRYCPTWKFLLLGLFVVTEGAFGLFTMSASLIRPDLFNVGFPLSIVEFIIGAFSFWRLKRWFEKDYQDWTVTEILTNVF